MARYGPLPISGAGKAHAVPGTGDHHGGGMSTFMFPISPPCTDCMITHALGGLEYPNGTAANTNTGMYLHHVVIFNNASVSATCPTAIPEFVFASANERTPASISINGLAHL